MINLFKKFTNINQASKNNGENNLELLCGLFVEAANSDGEVHAKEISKIEKSLIEVFNEDPIEVKKVLNNALENRNNSKSLFYYTSKINKEYSKEDKILLIETLWEIVLSDEKVHDYETSLIRRLSGLLYISDVNSGNARKRVLNKILNKK